MLKVDNVETTSNSLEGRQIWRPCQPTGLFLVSRSGQNAPGSRASFPLATTMRSGSWRPRPATPLQPAAGLFLACIRADDDEVGICVLLLTLNLVQRWFSNSIGSKKLLVLRQDLTQARIALDVSRPFMRRLLRVCRVPSLCAKNSYCHVPQCSVLRFSPCSRCPPSGFRRAKGK